jgi:hypothetical protein
MFVETPPQYACLKLRQERHVRAAQPPDGHAAPNGACVLRCTFSINMPLHAELCLLDHWLSLGRVTGFIVLSVAGAGEGDEGGGGAGQARGLVVLSVVGPSGGAAFFGAAFGASFGASLGGPLTASLGASL